jgi:hypothetical protein
MPHEDGVLPGRSIGIGTFVIRPVSGDAIGGGGSDDGRTSVSGDAIGGGGSDDGRTSGSAGARDCATGSLNVPPPESSRLSSLLATSLTLCPSPPPAAPGESNAPVVPATEPAPSEWTTWQTVCEERLVRAADVRLGYGRRWRW